MLLVGCDLIAKDIKPYLCNFEAENLNDCTEEGPSKYKFYVNGKFDAKDEDSYNKFIIDYIDTLEMNT